MSQRPPTVKYQLIWRELLQLAERVKDKSREDKDLALSEFARSHTTYITMGMGPDGRVKIAFHRNMVNYLRRSGEDVDRFKDIFLQSANRQYGSGTEFQTPPKRR